VSLLESAGPTRVFTIWRIEEPLVAAFPGASSWAVPAFVPVAGTTLGAIDMGKLTTWPTRFRIVNGKPEAVPKDQYATLPVEQQLDAVLYLGPASRQPIVPSAEPCRRPGFLDERLRRIALTGIPKFEAENIQKLCAAAPR
jgi:hypothetical protein